MRKGFAHPFLLFALILFALAASFIYLRPTNSAPTLYPEKFSEKLFRASPTPRPLQIPTPEGWETYDSPVGFSVSHPARFRYLGSTKDISVPSSCLVSIGSTGSTINLYIVPFSAPSEDLFFTRFPHEPRVHASFENVSISSLSATLINIDPPDTTSLSSRSAVIPSGNFALIPFWPEAKDGWESFLSSIRVGELDPSLCPDE